LFCKVVLVDLMANVFKTFEVSETSKVRHGLTILLYASSA
jgi:hypothetical protein